MHTHQSLRNKAGKNVFVEKPLALTVGEAESLCRKATDAGRILMVGHLLQYHPAFLRLKQLVHDGALGRLQYIYSNRLNLGKIRREENILWSFAPHDISMILGLVGDFDSKKALKLVKEVFGDWPKGPAVEEPEVGYRKEPAPGIYFVEK